LFFKAPGFQNQFDNFPYGSFAAFRLGNVKRRLFDFRQSIGNRDW
jgi:hypothetical protein